MIVAIDPSLTGTAVVFGRLLDFECQRFESVKRGDRVADRIDRCEDLVARVMKFIGQAVGDVEAVYLEGYTYGTNDNAAKFSVEYGGLLRWHLLELTDRIFEVSPTTLKKFATGKGVGKKNLIAAHLTKRYGVMFDSDDEFDAYGLYRLGLVAEGLVEPANQAQREAAATVLAPKVKKAKRKKKK